MSVGITLAKRGRQVSAIGICEHLGCVTDGPECEDVGIQHRLMCCTV